MRGRTILGALVLGATVLIDFAAVRAGKEVTGYGAPSDVAFAERLWTALRRDGWVGVSRRMASAQHGKRPHGSVQQVTKGELNVDGRRGRILVKANHRGNKLTTAKVMRYPNKYLSGYAVMFRRETGYDPANQDWFWVVFERSGSVRKFRKRAIAGRVDTGATNGCIGCHKKVGGRDLETLTEN